MIRRIPIWLVLAPAALAGCVAHSEKAAPETLARLHSEQPDLQEVKVEKTLEQALEGYRRFLEETPETAMTPEAMRRLADLQLEKQFGIREGDGRPKEMAAPELAQVTADSPMGAAAAAGPPPVSFMAETEEEFETRTTSRGGTWNGAGTGWAVQAASTEPAPEGPLEAIALYDRLLTEYPEYEHNDQVLYQKARAYDEIGRTEEAIETMEQLIRVNPGSVHYDEVQFRRGEYFFTRRKFRDAEEAYAAVLTMGTSSSYYELALYKLGWTFYKQELYEEALHRYMALLDYKVSIGYDFDETHTEEDERRVNDTFRVVSLSLSNLGGPEAVGEYFSTFGHRSYEDRVYENLGEHYLAKLRYDDAAKTYKAFEEIYPFHRSAPRFGMRLVDTFTKGGFPKLVLESRREFASKYGLKSEYWRHFDPESDPEVVAYLKSNLKDLATHYHAEYQATEEAEKEASYQEALRWYGEYLDSFPADPETPSINYRLADLHLENGEFGKAARQYEHTAYDYPPHQQSADAGYAAVYAFREQLKAAPEGTQDVVKRAVVDSSVKFADAFPDNENAPTILGAAADDLYELEEYGQAVTIAQRVIDSYPSAEQGIRRSAWIVVAHGSFETTDYPRAENGYSQVLALTPEEDESRQDFVENLAASIYKQGEIARESQDYRAAADNFLRIRTAAPTSAIRPTAEYDGGAALMEMQEWTAAADVLESFRSSYPEHELRQEATRQIAYAYREGGQLGRSAREYDRLAAESEDPTVRGEALLVAGDLYEQTSAREQALDVYTRYIDEFPSPIEPALETRFKIAEIHKAMNDDLWYKVELAEIVRLDAEAGPERTGRTRTLAARSALVLAEERYEQFRVVRLLQPFETSLVEKKSRMDETIQAMEHLVEYEIGEVTAAATYYMAETYLNFARSLGESERPADLTPDEMDEYEVALEEEAFPFEEKAIDLHEKNVELLHAGVLADWTEKSLGRLVELMPGRYAKDEVNVQIPDSLDAYVYRTPASQVQAVRPIPGLPSAKAPEGASNLIPGPSGAGEVGDEGAEP